MRSLLQLKVQWIQSIVGGAVAGVVRGHCRKNNITMGVADVLRVHCVSIKAESYQIFYFDSAVLLV